MISFRNLFCTMLPVITAASVLAQEKWSLQRCIDHAFQHNITLKQSELNLDRLELDAKSAWGQMLPNLNGNATHGYNWGQTIDPFTNQFATERIRSNSFGLSTQANLFSGFRAHNNVKRAQASVEGGKADLERAKNDLALGVASAYLTVLLNRELLATAQRNLEITDAQVKRVEKLVAAGQLPEGNLNELLASRASNHTTVVAAENNVQLAMLRLIQLIQLSDEEISAFDIATPDAGEADNLKLPADARPAVESALRNFPQIKSAQANIRSSEYSLKMAQGAAWPSLGASFSYGTGYSGLRLVPVGEAFLSDPIPIGYVEGSFTPVYTHQLVYPDYKTKPFADQARDNVNQSLFFSLQIPLFNGFSTHNNIALAKINRQNALYTLEQTRQQLSQEVQTAYADAQAARANYDAAKEATRASDKAFVFARSRFEQGAINAIDFNQAQLQLLNAQANEIRFRYEFLFRAKILDFYLGRAITLK